MDFIGDLVGAAGCAADGTTAARNPVSKLVDNLMEGSAPGSKYRGGSAAPPGAAMSGPPSAQMAAIHEGMARGMAMGQAGFGMPPPHFMHPPPPFARPGFVPPHPQDAWAREFQQSGGGMGGARAMSPPEAFEQAWRMDAEANAWADDFGRRPLPPPHVMEMHRREMEAVWHHENFSRQQQRMPPPGMQMPGDAWAHEFGAMGPRPGGITAQLQGAQSAAVRPSWADAPPAMSAQELDAAWAAGPEEAATAGKGPLVAQPLERRLKEQWAESSSAPGASFEAAAAASAASEPEMLEGVWGNVEAAMESAWEEARASSDPALQKLWEVDDLAAGAEGSAAGMEAAWARTAARLEGLSDGTAAGVGPDGAYQFQVNNPRLADEGGVAAAAMVPGDLFAEGIRLFEAGDIAEAVLCFEAELQRDPGNSEAWRMLGQSHAENDQDPLAITCLERAVEHDPYNLEALLALGVSYVNELDSQKALATLKAWVAHNPKYAGLEVVADEYSDGTLMDEVMQLMLTAEQWDAADADAKVVLGVLYNVSRDYDSAADAFRAALAQRSADHSLWNKLGATLANNSRSREALPAYERALRAKPRYARAWLNMGISHANLNRYEAAASCYLRALRLNPAAKHVWAYLRIVFTCMERFDLVQRAGAEDPDAFGAEFSGDEIAAAILDGLGG